MDQQRPKEEKPFEGVVLNISKVQINEYQKTPQGSMPYSVRISPSNSNIALSGKNTPRMMNDVDDTEK